MPLSPGVRIGSYDVISKLGEGGMGEVYRARDTRLGRDVALKVLPPEVTKEAGRLERFDREARAIAALNHPHIVTIYSTEEADGVRFLTMELVEGKTLNDVIAASGLPVARFLEIAIQIADALTAAHQKQITHRDLKPGNVMVTQDGRVKVLDFGLARVGGSDAGEHSLMATQAPITHQGMLVGTMPYMSPEQVEGRVPDPRSDLFSLGVIFYEMLSGDRPFKGTSSPALMSSILRDTPPSLCDARADVPDTLGRLIARCIEKRPEDRVQTARDVFNELRHLQKQSESTLSRASSSSGRRPMPVIAENLWIAVLPFSVRGADADADAMASALTEDISSGLARFRGLSVVASQSTRAFKDSPLDVRQIADRLSARYIISGGVRKSGASVRTTAQLIDAHSGAQLWSETYDFTLASDMFSIQDDVTDRIVATVADQSGVLARSMVRSVRALPAGELTARELLLRTWGHQHNPTPAEHAELRAAMEARLTSEPDNTDLFAELARLYLDEHILSMNPLPDSLGRALRSARRAIEIDPNHQRGWTELAATYFFQRNRAGLIEAAERAIRINPRNGHCLAWVGNLITHAGEYERGSAFSARAMVINPNHPGWVHFAIFNRHFAAREYDEALNAARRVNMPQLNWQHYAIATAAAHLNLGDEARRAYDAMIAITPALADPAVLRDFTERWYWDTAMVEALLDGISLAQSAAPSTRVHPSDEHSLRAGGQSSTSSPPTPRSAPGRPASAWAVWVAVMPFAAKTTDDDSRTLAEGLTDDITTGLSRFSYLRVLSRAAAERLAKVPTSTPTPASQPNSRYVIDGTVRSAGKRIRIGVRLADTHTGANLWAENFDRDISAGTFSVQDELTSRIVATMGDPSGVFAKAILTSIGDTPLEQLAAEELWLLFSAYGEQFRPEEHARLRGALERYVEREPKSACAWAVLSELYHHEHGFQLNTQPDALGRARRAAERAIEIDPRSQEAWGALAASRHFAGDVQGLRGAVERAVSLNPLNADAVALSSIYLSCSGEGERALELIRSALQLKPHHPGWYHFASYNSHYFIGDYEAALRESKLVNMPMLPLGHMSVMAAAGQLGRADDVRRGLDALRVHHAPLADPQLARMAWGLWFTDTALLDRLVEGFEKALVLCPASPGSDPGEPRRDGPPRSQRGAAARPSIGVLGSGIPVAVRPFTASGSDSAKTVADALTSDVGAGMARFTHIRVLAQSARDAATQARYALEGEVRASANACRVSARLIDVAAGVQVWSETYSRDLTADPFAIVDDVASHIVATVADGYGALLRAFAETVSDGPDLAAVGLVKRFYTLVMHVNAEDHARLRDEFEAVVREEPGNARAWAILAFLYAHERLYGLNVLPHPVERARAAAERAMAIDPGHQGSWSARATVAFLEHDLTTLRAAHDRAIEINPLHTHTLATAGVQLTYTGDTERGSALVRRAIELNRNAYPGWYHGSLFLDAFRNGDADAAFMHISRIALPDMPMMTLATLAAAGRFNRKVEAAAAVKDLKRRAPELLDPARAREVMERMAWPGPLLDSLVEGFEKALEAASPSEVVGTGDASIAVLPFKDLSPGGDQQWFCDGIAEDIFNALSRVDGLRVAAHASAFALRAKTDDLRTIGTKLDVTTVLEGSVRRSGDRVRITAQLSDAQHGRQLWSERFDRELKDIFEVQDEIAHAIVDRLRVKLTGKPDAPLVKKTTENTEAYSLCMKGRYHWVRRNRWHMRLALDCFEKAVKLDPGYALAHAGVSDCYNVMTIYGVIPGTQGAPPAIAAAERALALDPMLAESHHSMGATTDYLKHDYATAERYYLRALELNPKLAVTQGYLALMYSKVGRKDETGIAADAAVQMEPDSAVIAYLAGGACYWAGDLERADRYTSLALDLEIETSFPYWIRALTQSRRGEMEAAIATALRGVTIGDRQPMLLTNLGMVYGRAGRMAEAEAILTELHTRAKTEYIAPCWIADLLIGMGRLDEGIEWLDRAITEGNAFVGRIGTAAEYDPVRTHPKFPALLERLNLPS